MDLTIEAMKRVDAEELYRKFVTQEVRPDGRALLSVRKTTVTGASITTANGSSMVRLGSTSVVCGIKLEVAEPAVANPTWGFLVPNLDLSPICSAKYRPGPPPDQAQVLSETISRILNGSQVVNPSDLCIAEGKAVWVLYIDLVCLNDDGNLFDASLLATVSALLNLKLPGVRFAEGDGIFFSGEPSKPLALQNIPLPLTLGVFDGEFLLVDPSDEEEAILSSSFSIVLSPQGKLLSFTKHGGKPISEEVLRKSTELARSRAKELCKLLNLSWEKGNRLR